MKREKRRGPTPAISAAMRPLRSGDLADINIHLPAGAFADVHNLERALAIARNGGTVRGRWYAFWVLDDDADIVGAAAEAERSLRSAHDGAVAPRGGDIEIAAQIQALASGAAAREFLDIRNADKPSARHAAGVVNIPNPRARRGDGFWRGGGGARRRKWRG